MIERVEIRNFQSLYDVGIDIAKFTVIVGPSSSGKSAFMRALRTLASNSRGTSFLSYGQSQASVTARGQDWAVTLERGSHNGYKVNTASGDDVFTKLGGAVPDRVTQILGIQPISDGMSVNFADQFDRPYLVGETGQTVARVLGDLTNVSRIFEAVREANRRRQGAGGLLRTRTKDLEDLKEQAGQFRGLKEQQARVSEAATLVADARGTEARAARLEDALDSLIVSEAALAKYEEDLAEMPSLDALLESRDRFFRLDALLEVLSDAASDYRRAALAEREQAMLEQEVQEGIRQALARAGQCPTCGQEVANV